MPPASLVASTGRWLRARADDVAVALLAALFLTFVVQIASRYVLRDPFGWTVELCLTLWLWTVLWGGAFCLDDRDHVRFDMLWLASSRRLRRVLSAVSALAVLVGLVAAMPATWDYVSFYDIKKSGTLRIRLDYVFSIYLLFAVAVATRYALRLVRLVRGGERAAPLLDDPVLPVSSAASSGDRTGSGPTP